MCQAGLFGGLCQTRNRMAPWLEGQCSPKIQESRNISIFVYLQPDRDFVKGNLNEHP